MLSVVSLFVSQLKNRWQIYENYYSAVGASLGLASGVVSGVGSRVACGELVESGSGVGSGVGSTIVSSDELAVPVPILTSR